MILYFIPYKAYIRLIVILGILAYTPNAFAQNDLLVFPKRLVFEGTRDRAQTLTLHNNGKDTATYKISYVEMRMDTEGKLEVVTEPEQGQQFASPYLRFYPRTVTLAPNESQVVKVQLIKTHELQPGEYRSHLYFRSIKQKDKTAEQVARDSKNLSFSITPVYGISIANIIRIGDPGLKVEILKPAFSNIGDFPLLSMEFHLSSNKSAYGDITVTHVAPNGEKIEVASIKGLAVYVPEKIRKTKLQLKDAGVNYNSGKLVIDYKISDREVVHSEVELN